MKKLQTCLWFNGKAEEAANFYLSVFEKGKVNSINYYGKAGQAQHGQKEGTVMTVDFEVNGMSFLALNGGSKFKFNESTSFMIMCENQKEIDHFWSKLTADGGEEGPCGWCKDKYGLSWQVVPESLMKMQQSPDQAKRDRVMTAFMKMKKFDINTLEKAFHSGVQG